MLDLHADLDAHVRRRASGTPTLSWLVGDLESALGASARWANERDVGLAVVDARVSLKEIARAWIAELRARVDLRAIAAKRVFDGDPDEALRRFDRATEAEREQLLSTFATSDAAADLVMADALTLYAHGDGSTSLDSVPAMSCLRAYVELAGRDAPAIAFVAADADALARAARVAAEIVEALPRMTALVASHDHALPDTRGGALLREGRIVIATSTYDDGADRSDARRKRETPPAPEDRARSHAERFLFMVLEARDATRGLFELNATPGFTFGGRVAEIDLACVSLGVAIEIDGHHHFRDRDAYRRDRRKDVALQMQGYFVVRVLAEDIVARLEETLATIDRVIAARRGESGA